MSEGAIDTAADAAAATDSAAEGTDAGIYTEDGATDDTSTEDGTTTDDEGKKVEKVENVDDGTKEGDDKEAKASDKDADTVPETYEFSLPDGMELDEEGVAKFAEIGKELGITQAQANKLAEFYVDRLQQADKSGADALMTRFNAEATKWREESETVAPKGSPEREAAARAIERFGSDSTKKWLKESRLGDHPEMIRFCIRAGQAVTEDKLVTSDGPGNQKPDTAPEYDRGIYS